MAAAAETFHIGCGNGAIVVCKQSGGADSIVSTLNADCTMDAFRAFTGTEGPDTIVVRDAVNLDCDAPGYAGAGALGAFGYGANTLLLNGSDGDDTMSSGAGGTTVLYGGEGNDTLLAKTALTTANGEAGEDYLECTSGAGALNGGNDDDTLLVQNGCTGHGDAGNDDITVDTSGTGYGDGGNDTITVTSGAGIGDGGADADDLYVDSDGTIRGGTGNDRLTSTAATNVESMFGEGGSDCLDHAFIDDADDFDCGADADQWFETSAAFAGGPGCEATGERASACPAPF